MRETRHSGQLLLCLGLITLLTSIKCVASDDAHGPKCLNCQRVTSPTDCQQTTQCWAHEECYSQRLVSSSGATWYNFGCKTQQECRLLGTVSGKRRGFEPTITVCEQCCTGDACNTHICSPTTGPRPISCFSCSNIADLKACHVVKHCNPGEVCYSESVIEDSPVPKHTLGCVSDSFCSLLTGVVIGRRSSGYREKRKTQLCQKCCRTSGCNSDICLSQQSSLQVTPAVYTTMSTPAPSRIELRLVGSNSLMSGRLEVNGGNGWGTVCDDGFTDVDATVACRQLGFPDDTASVIPNTLQGSGPIWLDDLQCYGYESSLLSCRHTNWGQHNCGHNEDVFIKCGNDIRLVGLNSAVAGRLEVYHDLRWGTVCGDYFSQAAARVACRQLGFSGETAVTIPNTLQGSGPIWLDDVQCGGGESSLASCTHRIWGQHDCNHNRDVFLRCGEEIRLVGLNSAVAGRLEVYHQSQWGTVCDDSFDTADATVACRQLGFSGETALVISNTLPGSGPIWMDDLNCAGNELSLSSCPRSNLGQHNCQHNEDVFIRCGHDIRLVGMNSAMAGRLEVYHASEWGTVCDDSFSATEAGVACRQLGFSGQMASVLQNTLPGSGTIWLDDLRCSGSEASLFSCGHLNMGQHNCGHNEDVFISCEYQYPVRLVNGSSYKEGRVEVFHNGVWGTVCDDSFDQNEAMVICHMLGFSRAGAIAESNAYFGQGSSPILLDDLNCSGTEPNLDACQHTAWGSHNCQHSEDAGVICNVQ